ncbi:MAG: hypothetical protein ACJ76Z_14845 [Thermoleophilaceae bacterium]
MTIGGSLILIAAGAILRWAVTGTLSWLDVQTTGLILVIVGVVALIFSLLYTFTWSDRGLPPPPR